MIKLFLPGLVHNYKFNQKLVEFMRSNFDIRRFDYTISGYEGSFSYCNWNGDLNNNYGRLMTYYNLVDFQKDMIAPLILDCSNILLSDKDFFDTHQNTILKIFDDTGSSIELSLLDLKDYIKNNYNNYNFIISDKIDLIQPLTEETINLILDQEDIKYLILPSRFYNNLPNINKKDKIIINLNDSCCNCIKYNECKLNEQQNQYLFSGYSQIANCNTYSFNNINLESKIKHFTKLGFFNFRIIEPAYRSNYEQFDQYLIDNLIKDEYKIDFYKMLRTK